MHMEMPMLQKRLQAIVFLITPNGLVADCSFVIFSEYSCLYDNLKIKFHICLLTMQSSSLVN